jgi:SNF2 family DNA or RNA helicase
MLYELEKLLLLCAYVIFQNPQCDLQAQDRCHRIGQVKPVVVYRFCTKSTVDEKILLHTVAKRKLEKIVIGNGKLTIKIITDKL